MKNLRISRRYVKWVVFQTLWNLAKYLYTSKRHQYITKRKILTYPLTNCSIFQKILPFFGKSSNVCPDKFLQMIPKSLSIVWISLNNSSMKILFKNDIHHLSIPISRRYIFFKITFDFISLLITIKNSFSRHKTLNRLASYVSRFYQFVCLNNELVSKRIKTNLLNAVLLTSKQQTTKKNCRRIKSVHLTHNFIKLFVSKCGVVVIIWYLWFFDHGIARFYGCSCQFHIN